MSKQTLSKEALDYLSKWNTDDQISTISPALLNIIEALVKEPHMKPIDNPKDFDTAKFLCTLKDGTAVKMFTNPKGVDHIFLADSKFLANDENTTKFLLPVNN